MTFADLHASLRRVLTGRTWSVSVEAWGEDSIPKWKLWISGGANHGTHLESIRAEGLLAEAESYAGGHATPDTLEAIGDAFLPAVAPAAPSAATGDPEIPF